MNNFEFLKQLTGCSITEREDGVIEIAPSRNSKTREAAKEEYQFKNGDFIYTRCYGVNYVGIFKESDEGGFISEHAYAHVSSGDIEYPKRSASVTSIRLATEDEKRLLLEALHKERKIWNAETKQIEDDKEPKIGDKCVFWDDKEYER